MLDTQFDFEPEIGRQPPTDRSKHPWWRSAVIYQVYIRSFADANGDGIGDIDGLRSRLGYLAELGVDAIWINPWYPSPMADAGYDVADYRNVDRRFGTLDDAEALLREADQHGLKVLLDLVPNHSSDQHRWFKAAVGAEPGSPERDRYIFRDGTGPDGELPPNDWQSQFGGSAWTRITEPDGRPGQWYLHLFAPEQPDVNWRNADIEREFIETLRFWFDRGVDGFRIDVAHSLVKQDGLPDVGTLTYPLPQPAAGEEWPDHPYWDRDGVHEIYRNWRRVADSYPEPKVFVAEAWVRRPERLALYVRDDELHTAFNFEFLQARWDAAELRTAIDGTLAGHAAVGAPPTWVLSNHDGLRHVSRYARDQALGPSRWVKDVRDRPADLDLGRRRARAALLLELALPGSVYLYQGEELGLPEVEDLDPGVLQDPKVANSGGADPGRDGCRVPIPWSGSQPPYGFSPTRTTTWLPQPDNWAALTVAAETGDPDSMLELYRSALRLHRANPALGDGDLRWLPGPDGTLVFERSAEFRCLTNVSAGPVALPADTGIVLASGPLDPSRAVPPDTTVWLSTSA